MPLAGHSEREAGCLSERLHTASANGKLNRNELDGGTCSLVPIGIGSRVLCGVVGLWQLQGNNTLQNPDSLPKTVRLVAVPLALHSPVIESYSHSTHVTLSQSAPQQPRPSSKPRRFSACDQARNFQTINHVEPRCFLLTLLLCRHSTRLQHVHGPPDHDASRYDWNKL